MTTFPNETAVRRAVVAEALKDLGYQGPVGGWNKWGAWYGPGWQNAYFCAAGWSWCWNKAVGESMARNIIGFQTHGGTAPHRRGYIWTVGLLVQNRHRGVALRNLKPGDALMMKFVTGDNRAGNETNHVDLVEMNYPNQQYMVVIGYNVPKPGAPAGSDPSRGGGVWRRRIYYNNPQIVAGLQMPAHLAVTPSNPNQKEWARVQEYLNNLELGEFQMTGVRGPATIAAIKNYSELYGYTGPQNNAFILLPHMEATMTNILSELRAIRSAQSNHDRILNSHGQALGKVVNQTEKSAIGSAVWTHPLYGTVAHWLMRMGMIPDPNHPNFPADPGSFMDKVYRDEAAQTGGFVTVYIPSRNREVTLRLDAETDSFVLVEDS